MEERMRFDFFKKHKIVVNLKSKDKYDKWEVSRIKDRIFSGIDNAVTGALEDEIENQNIDVKNIVKTQLINYENLDYIIEGAIENYIRNNCDSIFADTVRKKNI